MTVKTDMSRFHIHDELTAPEGSIKILKGVQAAGGSVSKFIGVLAGAPAALRSYARMRHELRGGSLPQATRERIGLAVAERRGDPYSIAQHAKTARAAGLGLDEISRARSFESADPKEAALLAFLEALLDDRRPAGPAPRRGGARARLDRRGAARGGRPPGDERVPEPDRERRGAAAGPVGPGGAAEGRLGRASRLRRAWRRGRRRCSSKRELLRRSAWVRSHLAPLANGPRSITVVRT